MTLFFLKIFVFSYKLVPMWLLYFYSDILTFILNHILTYRKKVIYKNLSTSFPEKTEKEIKKIANKFYKHLADLILEGLKGFSMSQKEILKRYKVVDVEGTKHLYENEKNIIFATGHYGNWEWGFRATPLQLYHKSVALFKPLKNKKINEYFRKLRSKDKIQLISIRATARAFYNQNKPFCVVMAGDQNPSNREKAIWVDFLNQPTACLHGIEFYAKRYDTAVVFAEFRKVKRGYYEVHFDQITENPKEMADGQITKTFMNKLEKVIRERPEYWLWSHKRWKQKYNPETDKIIR